MRLTRFTVPLVGAAILIVGSAVPALAADPAPPPAPSNPVTCYPILSSLVCQIPVNVGPFNIPVNIPVNFKDVIGVPTNP
jgi:hypothetical protein